MPKAARSPPMMTPARWLVLFTMIPEMGPEIGYGITCYKMSQIPHCPYYFIFLYIKYKVKKHQRIS